MGKQFLEITEKKEVEELIAELSAKIAAEIAITMKTEKVRLGDGAGEALGRIASTDIFPRLISPF